MSLKIEYHDTEVEIAGLRFPMHQSYHIQDCCRKAMALREKQRQGEQDLVGWQEWSAQEDWSSQDQLSEVLNTLKGMMGHHWSALKGLKSAAAELVEKITEGQRLKEVFERGRVVIENLQSELSGLYSDGVFSTLSPADLSDAELSTIVSGLDKGGHVNPDEVYTPYVDDGDIEVSSRARLALSLKTELSTVGVHLRWPSPPFNDDFDLQLEEELCFQLGWSVKLLELSGELSEDERLSLSLPLSPYSEGSVAAYVGSHKGIVSERGLWAKLGFGQGLSEEGRKRLKALKEIRSMSWKSKEMYLGIFCVDVSGGRFRMGALPSDGEAYDREKPCHKVKISSDMVVMKYPVTQWLYEQVMGSNPSHFKGGERPVEKVSWFDAVKFANALSLRCGLSEAYRIDGKDVSCDWNSDGWRLPTEAEWEYLARGGEEHLYAGSDDIDSVAWYYGNSGSETHPVGQKQANGFGLYDMTGNVWEWCWDWSKRDYSSGSVTDPRGPSSGSLRVCRGGSWGSNAGVARASYRGSNDPSYRYLSLGFRLLRKKI